MARVDLNTGSSLYRNVHHHSGCHRPRQWRRRRHECLADGEQLEQPVTANGVEFTEDVVEEEEGGHCSLSLHEFMSRESNREGQGALFAL